MREDDELDGVPTEFRDRLVSRSEVPPGAGSPRDGLRPLSGLGPGNMLVGPFLAVLLSGFAVDVIGDLRLG